MIRMTEARKKLEVTLRWIATTAILNATTEGTWYTTMYGSWCNMDALHIHCLPESMGMTHIESSNIFLDHSVLVQSCPWCSHR
jgi:hypothetical protein